MEDIQFSGFAVKLPKGKKWLQYNPLEERFVEVTKKERDKNAQDIEAFQRDLQIQHLGKAHKRLLGSDFILRVATERTCSSDCGGCWQKTSTPLPFATLSIEAVKSVLDFKITEAKMTGETLIKIKVSGGEPTLYPKALKEIVELVKVIEADPSNPIEKIVLILETNGDFGVSVPSRTIESAGWESLHAYWQFLAEEFDILRISFDGLPEIHSKTRPSKHGVEDNNTQAKQLVERISWMCQERKKRKDGVDIAINAVIPSFAISEIPASIDFMLREFPESIITLNPDTQDPTYETLLFLTTERETIENLKKSDRRRILSRVASPSPDIIYSCAINGDVIEVIPTFLNGRKGAILFTCPTALVDSEVAKKTRVGDWNIEKEKELTIEEDAIKFWQSQSFGASHICWQLQCPAVFTCGGGCFHRYENGKPAIMAKGLCGEVIVSMLQIMLRDQLSDSQDSFDTLTVVSGA